MLGDFTFSTAGGLISAEFLRQLRDETVNIKGIEPRSFNLPWRDAPKNPAGLEDNIARSWETLKERWDNVHRQLPEMSDADSRRQWLSPLLQQLDYKPDYQRGDMFVGEQLRFNFSLRGWDAQTAAGKTTIAAPIMHTVPPHVSFDQRIGKSTAPKHKSPHDQLQIFLNSNAEHKWGTVSNGVGIRLLRDFYHSFTKGYVEFDLQSLFERRTFSDFRAFYRLFHASRFLPLVSDPALTAHEYFYTTSRLLGTRIESKLRVQALRAIEILCNGFIKGSRTGGNADTSPRLLYETALHTIYRLLFLMYAEQRGLIPSDDAPLKELYRQEYSIESLRKRADAYIENDDQLDLWEGLQVTFRMVKDGADTLGVFGYNGMLFGQMAADTRYRCPNTYLLQAIRALSLTEVDGVLQRVNYADISVEELGSMYEGLLDHEPAVPSVTVAVEKREIPAGTFYLRANSSERKKSGSYYTDKSLVRQLVKTALLPVMHQRLAALGLSVIPEEEIGVGYPSLLTEYSDLTDTQRQDALAAMRAIKVCDPAAGSGHFLVTALSTMAEEFARLSTGELYPAISAFQEAKREILVSCIYAVDLNPQVLEICKLALWITAALPDKPLNYLDHHIRLGNSLIGVTPDMMANGLPSGTFALGISGDDRNVAKKWRSQHLAEVKRFEKSGVIQMPLLEDKGLADRSTDMAKLRSLTLQEIEKLAAEKPSKAEELHQTYRNSPAFKRKKFLHDLYAAAFFWPLTNRTDWVPTFDAIERLKLSDASFLTPEIEERVEQLTKQYRFFHWHLEFEDVFDEMGQGGFDVILSNPPWDIIQDDNNETDLGAFERTKSWFKHGEYSILKGRRDLYKLFVVASRKLIDVSSRCGMIIPFGMFVEDDLASLRRNLFTENSVLYLQHYQNQRKLFFPDVHASYRFVSLVFSPDKTLPHRFSTVIPSPAKFGEEIWVDIASVDLIEQLGEDFAAILYPDGAYFQLHNKLIEQLRSESQMDFYVLAEFHSTSDRKKGLLARKPINDDDWRTLKNRSIHQFNVNFNSADQYVRFLDVGDKCEQKGLDKDIWTKQGRVLFRDIARNDDTRTLLCCYAPTGYVSSYDTPMIVPVVKAEWMEETQHYICGLLNSFVFDFLIRPFVDKHIKGYVLKRLPLLTYDREDDVSRRIAQISQTLNMRFSSLDRQTKDYEKEIFSLRVELDIMVAKLVGLTLEELEYVLSTFVDNNDNDLQYGIATKQDILGQFDLI